MHGQASATVLIDHRQHADLPTMSHIRPCQMVVQALVEQLAVRALAFKWIRIYRCWKTRTPYDESVYLKALKNRGSPSLANLSESTKMT